MSWTDLFGTEEKKPKSSRKKTKLITALVFCLILLTSVVSYQVGYSMFQGSLNSSDRYFDATMPYSYSFDTNGTHYFAFNGTTHKLDYSGTNGTLVIQTALDTGAKRFFFRNGTYYIITLTIGSASSPSTGGIVFEGESLNVLFRVTGSQNGITVNTHSNVFRNFVITPDSAASAQNGIYINNVQKNYFENVAVGYTTNINQGIYGKQQFANAGIYLYTPNTGNGCEETMFVNCEVRGNVNYGYYFGATDPVYTAYIIIMGGYVGGGWYNGGTWDSGIRYPTDKAIYMAGYKNIIECVSIQHSREGIHFGVAGYENKLIGVAMENIRNCYINASEVLSQVNWIHGCTFWSPAAAPPPTTPFDENPNLHILEWHSLSYLTNRGNATGTSPIYVAHLLPSTPDLVIVTAESTGGDIAVTYTRNATHITIYHNAGTSITVSWYVEYWRTYPPA